MIGTGPWPTRIVLVLLAVHVAFGVARIPTKVVARRIEDVAEFRELGATAYHLDNEHRQGADAVQRAAATPENTVVLWRGDWSGALEFVPALLAPRLLVDERHVPAGARTFLGRPLATLDATDGDAAVIVLVGFDDRVELALR